MNHIEKVQSLQGLMLGIEMEKPIPTSLNELADRVSELESCKMINIREYDVGVDEFGNFFTWIAKIFKFPVPDTDRYDFIAGMAAMLKFLHGNVLDMNDAKIYKYVHYITFNLDGYQEVINEIYLNPGFMDCDEYHRRMTDEKYAVDFDDDQSRNELFIVRPLLNETIHHVMNDKNPSAGWCQYEMDNLKEKYSEEFVKNTA